MACKREHAWVGAIRGAELTHFQHKATPKLKVLMRQPFFTLRDTHELPFARELFEGHAVVAG